MHIQTSFVCDKHTHTHTHTFFFLAASLGAKNFFNRMAADFGFHPTDSSHKWREITRDAIISRKVTQIYSYTVEMFLLCN